MIREDCQSTLHAGRDRLLQIQDEFEKIAELLHEHDEQLRSLTDRFGKYSEQYAQDKALFNDENKRNGDEIEHLEYDLQKMRNDMSASYLKSQQALQKATIQYFTTLLMMHVYRYDQTLTRTAEEKELVGKEIFKVLEELINFKTFVETSLDDIRRL